MNLIWFRNDLRVHDNLALIQAMANGACKAIYMPTPKQWASHDVGDIKIAFIQAHINELSDSLAKLGVRLDVLNTDDFDTQISTLNSYCREHKITQVFANSEPELNEVIRDRKAQQQVDVGFNIYESDVIVAKGTVRAQHGEMFKVFTPFKKTWIRQAAVQQYVPYSVPNAVGESLFSQEQSTSQHNFTDNQHAKKIVKKWPLASRVREQQLALFFEDKHENYHDTRDFPAQKGTSGLSAYLAIGAISANEVMAHLLQHSPRIFDDMKANSFAWLNELVWRDFYRHLQYHYPQLAKGECFQPRYQNLPWHNNQDNFEAWCNGNTGYPLVDAAMRQLNTTGWMHNRLRMVVASFLTKHLLIDWHWGESYFMQKLIDGDFSANNGGWQWAASTGCDAQPYFRVFNPIRQSERFDPDGEFIRMYLPELKDVPIKSLHFPHKYLEDNRLTQCYVKPLVDHKTARLRALAFYKDHIDQIE